MLTHVRRWIVAGLITILPIAVTIAVLWWLLQTVGRAFSWVFPQTWPEWVRIPLGLLLSFAIVVLAGLVARLYIGQKFIGWGGRLLERIPVAKTIYGSVKDVVGLMSGKQKRGFSDVAVVKIGGARLLGLVTRYGIDELPEGLRDHIAVYLPMSYQIGGFTVIVPKESIEKVEMSVENAVKFTMTAGLSSTGTTEPVVISGAAALPADDAAATRHPNQGNAR